MKLTLLIFLISLSARSFDVLPYCKIEGNLKNETCENKTSLKEVNDLIAIIIGTQYKDLIKDYANGRIQTRLFKNDNYFLKTSFKLSHILKNQRTYFIDINEKLFECAPDYQSLKAILMHEVQHLSDYKKMNLPQLVKLGVKMITRKGRSFYERQTDLAVMEKGQSIGIRGYRNWIYEKLDSKGLKFKRCYYYTPEEIDRFISGERDFSDYFEKYCKNIRKD
jgi:hypothetical protein